MESDYDQSDKLSMLDGDDGSVSPSDIFEIGHWLKHIDCTIRVFWS